MVIWTGAGLHGLFFCFFIVWGLLGIDPDDSSARFFLASAPLILMLGIVLIKFAAYLQYRWSISKDNWHLVNKVFTFLKCDFSVTPTVFFIPLHFWAIVSVLIGVEEWIRVGII